MEDLLHGDLAIGEKEIHAFTGQAAGSQRCCSRVTDAHEVSCCIGINDGEVGAMSNGNHKQVPDIHRLNVHEGGAPVGERNLTGRGGLAAPPIPGSPGSAFPG